LNRQFTFKDIHMSIANGYPALLERSTNESHTLNGASVFVVGRSQSADLPILDVQCSRQQFKIFQLDNQYMIESISTKSPTFCNGIMIESPRPIHHGMIIQSGASVFVFLEREDSNVLSVDAVAALAQQSTMVSSASAAEFSDRTAMYTPESGPPGIDLKRSITLTDQMLIGRDQERVSIHLPHSQVSRVHAQIIRRDRLAVVTDLNSANGTFVNGTRITQAVTIRTGDQIDIGPYALTFDGKTLLPRSRVNNVELACRDLSRIVKNRETGGNLVILDCVNLIIRPREFVCLLGPSGSGKSTLLSALSARKPAEQGKVTINGEDLYANFEALKRDIAVVPQQGVLHDFLDLKTALEYTARLRLPPDTSSEEIAGAVADMLHTVALESRSGTQIRNLSGGQLKRASLANEIVSKPSLLFLDEVTSGLDEQTDADMMRLFRRIADGGKTVVCVTHSLSHVEESCHRVVILAEGGKLAFVGSPAEAVIYFNIDRLGGIYEKLSTRSPDQWKQQFSEHPLYEEHVPKDGDSDSDIVIASVVRAHPSVRDHARLFGRQTQLLTKRYLQIQIADVRSLSMMFGQCLLIGLLIVVLFGDISDETSPARILKSSQIMFFMAISVFWFGCNNAAKEIAKERTIFTRERDVNLLITSYVASKVLLLGAMSWVQATLLYILVGFGTSVDGSASHYILLTTLAIAGVSLGLFISAVANTTDLAVTVVPLVLIPQVIFSGAIESVTGLAKALAALFIVIYWTYGGLIASFTMETAEYLGFEEWSPLGVWMMIVFHIAVYLTGALAVLYVAGSREATYGKAVDKLLASANARIKSIAPDAGFNDSDC